MVRRLLTRTLPYERGLATFQPLCHRRNEPLYAFGRLELNGMDLRREPIEVRKATLLEAGTAFA